MNLTRRFIMRRAEGRPTAVAGGLVLASITFLAGSPAQADMYRPQLMPGGIDPHPRITALKKNGTNATISWYGLEGTYRVQMAPSLTHPAWTNVASTVSSDFPGSLALTNLHGSQNFFRLNPDNSYLGPGPCAGCHLDTYSTWQRTPHAHALSLVSSLPPAVLKSCLPCHTTGYGQPTGFVSTNVTPNLTDVSCENCHGPGAAHKYGNHLLVRPAATVAAEVCGGCHGDSYNPTYLEWTNSPHASVTPDVASGFGNTPSGQSRMMNCGPCHSGPVRLAMLGNYQQMQAGYTNPVALPTANDAMTFAQTCTVCHDPHSTNGGPVQLRNPISSTNFYTFFTGTATNRFGAYMNTVFATQYVASVQICAQCHNSRGAKWTDTSRQPHHSPQYNMLLGNVGEVGSDLPPYQPSTHARFFTNQCVDCHMQSRAYQSATNPAVTGHKFTVESFDLCVQCHGPYSSNLVAFATETFLPAQAAQVKSALDFWALTKAPAALSIKYGARAWEYTSPGDLSTGGPGPNASEQALIPDNIKKARFNLYLFYNDRASGIHNPLYVLTLVDAALNLVQQELNQ